MKHRAGIFVVVFLLATAGLALADVDEKSLNVPKDQSVLQDLRAVFADSTTGTLNGGPTYDRIFTSDVSLACAATSTFSGIGVGVEYALIPFHTTTDADPLIASLANAGTDISDSVLSVYCEPFDPANADQNLVAYNDDAVGLLSGFDGTEGINLSANTTYYLVVSLFSPTSIGGGNFELTIGGDFVFGPYQPPTPTPGVVPVPTTSRTGIVVLIAGILLAAVFVLRRNTT